MIVTNDLILYNYIREFRKKFNLSQLDLALLVGVSKNAISSYETYKYYPSAYVAMKLCIIFDVEFGELFKILPPVE